MSTVPGRDPLPSHPPMPKGVSHTFTKDTGTITTTTYGSRLVLVRITGHLDLEITPHLMRPIDRVMHSGLRVVVFHDWGEVESYESKVRTQLTEWALKNRQQIEAVHVLQRSRMVAMAVSVANLALGGMLNSYMDRARFEKAFIEVHKTLLGG